MKPGNVNIGNIYFWSTCKISESGNFNIRGGIKTDREFTGLVICNPSTFAKLCLLISLHCIAGYSTAAT